MRNFSNGSLKMDGNPIFGMPVRNTARVPLANHPAPHILRSLSPERMYCEYNIHPLHIHKFSNDYIHVICLYLSIWLHSFSARPAYCIGIHSIYILTDWMTNHQEGKDLIYWCLGMNLSSGPSDSAVLSRQSAVGPSHWGRIFSKYPGPICIRTRLDYMWFVNKIEFSLPHYWKTQPLYCTTLRKYSYPMWTLHS